MSNMSDYKITEERKDEIITDLLGYVDEILDGIEQINVLMNCVGMNKKEMEYYGFEYSDECWVIYHEEYSW